jgi:hypothetical protein
VELDSGLHILQGGFIGIALPNDNPFQTKRISYIDIGVFFDNNLEGFHPVITSEGVRCGMICIITRFFQSTKQTHWSAV